MIRGDLYNFGKKLTIPCIFFGIHWCRHRLEIVYKGSWEDRRMTGYIHGMMGSHSAGRPGGRRGTYPGPWGLLGKLGERKAGFQYKQRCCILNILSHYAGTAS